MIGRFLANLSALLRTGDTRPLELVVGLLAVTLGIQLGVALLDWYSTGIALLTLIPRPIACVLAVALVAGGLAKVLGAIQDLAWLRMTAAIGLSGVWFYLAATVLQLDSIFAPILYLILATQSAWVYVRLSILRKRDRA